LSGRFYGIWIPFFETPDTLASSRPVATRSRHDRMCISRCWVVCFASLSGPIRDRRSCRLSAISRHKGACVQEPFCCTRKPEGCNTPMMTPRRSSDLPMTPRARSHTASTQSGRRALVPAASAIDGRRSR